MRKHEQCAEKGTVAIGDYAVSFSLIRSKARKRTVAFKMEADATLRVLAPMRTSWSSIAKILQKRAPWIVRELARNQNEQPVNDFVHGTPFSYLGYACTLSVTRGAQAPQSCTLRPRYLCVHVPNESLTEEDLRQEVKLEVILWLKKRARSKLKKRLDLWSKKLGVCYKKLVVTNPDRRWGSCSSDNVVRLNWRLMMAPLPIIDYVVAHELAHVRHKDHSAKFWSFLEHSMPDYGARRKELRTIERRLMI